MSDFTYDRDGILLENRYGSKICLRKIYDDKLFDEIKLICNDFVESEVYVLEGDLDYMRVIYNSNECNDNDIYAVDPSGGPFMSIEHMYIKNETYQLKCIMFSKTKNEYIFAFGDSTKNEN